MLNEIFNQFIVFFLIVGATVGGIFAAGVIIGVFNFISFISDIHSKNVRV